MAATTILTLVRHGETAANVDGVWHGSIDTPLSERGERQAQRVASHLADRFDGVRAVYASPLQRARNTAQAIADALGLALQLESGLTEFHLGEWEGKTYRELYDVHRLWHHMKDDPDFRPHGGESPRQVTERFVGALRRIHDAHGEERVVVVAHGGALSMALAHIVDGDYREWKRVMSNCAVSELVLSPEPALLSFNETGHLDDV